MSKPHLARSASSWLLIGISLSVFLGFFVWPSIQGFLQNAMLTSAQKNLQNFRTAAVSYVTAQGKIPLDGTLGAYLPDGGFARGVDGRDLRPDVTTFGDLLVSGGYLPEIRFPFGSRARPGSWDRGHANWPEIRAMAANSVIFGQANLPAFSSAPEAGRIVFLTIPGLSLGQAAALKRKLDLVTISHSLPQDDWEVLRRGLVGSPDAGGDVQFLSGDNNQSFTALVFIIGE